jgi:1-pyrroline-5-carboxylate dehydrogenase
MVSKATIGHAQQAMEVAEEKFKTWRHVKPEMRANILFKAAAIIRRSKFEFSSLITTEAGKPWTEADADTAEAIDFLEYYGREMLRLKDDPPLYSPAGEHNHYEYIPLGVGVVLSPWNFPLATMAGTTAAAIVTGNTVLLKPASATPVIAYKFVEVMEEAGLPAGVLNFIPGSGAEVGDYLADHPKTRFISFTGSREIGLRINERSSKLVQGQVWIKRMIAEMGGKGTIVVDRDADIELAAQSIVISAFGFSGQKCSACSRAVIVEDIYEQVVSKVVELTKELKMGDPAHHENFLAPVINDSAFKRIAHYIDIGKSEGRLVAGGGSDDSVGYYIKPAIFADVHRSACIMKEEIFGPVLAITKAKDFMEAIEMANDIEYGLTGIVISNNRLHLEQARIDFHVENLYFNQECTDASNGYQHYGRFNISGTGSKAGGPGYLQLHMQVKTMSEKF